MSQPAGGQKRKRGGERQGGQRRSKSNYKGKQRATQEGSEQGLTAGKLHHSLQLIARAAKKARTFEVQKLVRKIKSDKAKAESPAGTSKLHAEIEDILTTLKSLDAEELATQALSSKLHKDKSGLSNNAHVQAFVASHPTQNIDGTSVAAKAQNRILANKVVVQCMQEVIESLRQKAGIASAAKLKQKESAKSAKQNNKSALTAQNLAKVATSSAGKGQAAAKPEKHDDETSSEEDSDIEEGSSGTASHISAEESLPDDEFEGIQKGEEDESEEDAEDDQDDDAGSISGASTSSFPVVSKQKEPIMDTAKSKKQRTAEMSPPTTSAFLPSLAAGYTLGDSDGSVYSDDEAADTKPQRKNRRGQRARQAIWERKYGKNAKHVIKSKQREAETEEARQKAKAEREIEHLKKTGRYVYGVESNLTKPSEGKAIRTWTAAAPTDDANEKVKALLAAEADNKAKKTPQSNALHPSWEARKKAKEAEATLASAKPAGKKIVFD